MLTLYLSYLPWGADPGFYRFCDALILALASAALVYMSFLIFEVAGGPSNPGGRNLRRVVAAFIGLLFLVHPLQSFVVLYIWQRAACLACLFLFAAVCSYVTARSGKIRHPAGGYALTGLSFFAGMLSKENVIILPVILLLIEVTLFRASWRQTLRRALIIACVTLPVLALYSMIAHALHGPESNVAQGFLERLFENYAKSGLTVAEVFMTESRVWLSYVADVFAPFIREGRLVEAETVSRSLWSPPSTFIACSALLMGLVAGFALIRRAPMISFGLLWFVITLTPESALIPYYLFFGYRPILPMAGLLILIGWAAIRAAERRQASYSHLPVNAGIAIALVAGACFAYTTWERAKQWNPLQFWKSSYDRLPVFTKDVEKTPYLDVALNYGAELVRSGNDKEERPF